jgi:hypothetical protein
MRYRRACHSVPIKQFEGQAPVPLQTQFRAARFNAAVTGFLSLTRRLTDYLIYIAGLNV